MNKGRNLRRINGEKSQNISIGFLLGMMLGGLIDTYTGDSGVATICGMILGSIVGYRAAGNFYMMEYPRKSIRNLVIAGSIFFAVFLTSIYLISHGISKSVQLALALMPIIPGIFLMHTVGKAISRLDEVQRKIQEDAIKVGFGMTALIVMVFGLLELSGIAQPRWMFMPLIMVIAWLAGKLYFRWRFSS